MKSSFKRSDIFKYMIIALASYLSKQVMDHLLDSADDKNIEQVANDQKQEELKKQVISGTIQGHDFVDLGLSVKWATCNVGAENPWDYGDYFAWGEKESKDIYKKKKSSAYDVSYLELKRRGVVGETGNLTPYNDAAFVNWGSEWRMPTHDEQRELFENCKYSWTKFNGVYGVKFTGKNGNFVFLPASGYRCDGELNYVDNYGYYWSSSFHEYRCNYARNLYFYEKGVYWNYGSSRRQGYPVRPVSE